MAIALAAVLMMKTTLPLRKKKPWQLLSLSLSESKSLQSKKTHPNAKVSLKRPSEGDPNAKFSLKPRSEGDPNTISLRLPLVQEQFQIEPHPEDSSTSSGP
jgi:hypothetical protein